MPRVRDCAISAMSKAYSYLWRELNGLNYKQRPKIAQVDEVIETKDLAKGHKPVGNSGARTRGLVIGSLALFHWTTRTL